MSLHQHYLVASFEARAKTSNTTTHLTDREPREGAKPTTTTNPISISLLPGEENISLLPQHVNLVPRANDLPARLLQAFDNWSFASKRVQRIIKKELTWKWRKKPPALQIPLPSLNQHSLQSHLEHLLSKGVIHEVPMQPCYTSRIFTVPKSNGEERLIIDLHTLNTHIPCPSFKMLDAHKIRHSIPKQALFTSIDLSDAFHHIPIHPRFQKFLSFTFAGRLFFFRAMPFGLNLGPRVFAMVISQVLKHMHTQGIATSVYIDDWLLWAREQNTLLHHTQIALNTLSSLGFTINYKKSILQPAHHITYFGILWDGLHHTMSPAPAYITKTTAFTALFLRKRVCKKKEFQLLLFLINFAAPLCKRGKQHLRAVVLEAPRFRQLNKTKTSSRLRSHLRWWSATTNLQQAVPMSPPPPSLTIWTDASDSGWGGVSSLNQEAWGVWSTRERTWHINWKECLAVQPVLNTLLALLPPHGSSLLVRTDNTVVVALINKQGSNTSRGLNKLASKLLHTCDLHSWTIRASHIPGSHKTWADSLSRERPVRSEWSVSKESFQLLTKIRSPMIDLFAHPGNAKLPTFGCPFRHQSATVFDALTADWKRWGSIYLFPPTDLIPLCLRKLLGFQGDGIFVAPVLPTAPWWAELIGRCSPVDAKLVVEQHVRGIRHLAEDETSLIFRAFVF